MLSQIRRLRVTSWNVASLFGAAGLDVTSSRRHRRKMSQVCRLKSGFEFLALQEVRGTAAESAQFHHHVPRMRVFSSSYRRGQAGGSAFIMSETFCSMFEEIYVDEVVPGRVVILRCRTPDGLALDVVNVHVFRERLPARVMLRRLNDRICRQISVARLLWVT